MSHFTAVILAAGKGTRMKSELPKVMHTLAGRPLIDHVLEKVAKPGINDVITIVGHGREMLSEHLGERTRVVVQEEQLGTGHAMMQVLPLVDEDSSILVLSGDQPLLAGHTLQSLMEIHQKTGSSATVLTAIMENPSGYGRILKENNVFQGIIEEKDADALQKGIKEINTGTYCFNGAALKFALQKITPKNAQGEYYLTDVFDILLSSGQKIEVFCTNDPSEALGINNRVQLAEAEDILYDRIRKYWMMEGVTIINPPSVFIDAEVVLGKDVILNPFTIIKGNTRIEEGANIGPSTTLINCVCQKGCQIEHSVARDAVIGENCLVGPYAYLRPGTVLGKEVKVGDFVEIKNSIIEEGTKVPHLSYIGDSRLGKNVNIGAGTITCNYDGENKHQTIIEDRVFVGSNTNFVAPVSIGKEAVIGAGSTITKDVPGQALAIERSQQRIIENWHSAKKK
ncbi:MAG: bifunctional UDP-N-acetylglucosamine diphosphorylase/glucosamine-1-phosphate N-acetyltransferase GlmU [Dehalobacter sp. 4CP]|uniref:bifunctional UDP-N-acetylglucosamine diphosphorylase/glucosamine-1-phosphate N-acetyltransferase GlmU n=1 Tax=Dehalobacter sp. CP TaxID=2594474 RepID=UPI0013CC94FF|nr:bifunctional UDP-N-acetylglucosamine diphosphorylase/glucosamine-1-phosphate N-acetyltransferase GlmU [Dehalobacter sp.]NBJ16093.1 bifunctional UDP-N-acetylglucosamine diphosphorylase/glucosamine-1-phosphate N-acetyltransferase GlmU [Dehalobacter sp. 4CP]